MELLEESRRDRRLHSLQSEEIELPDRELRLEENRVIPRDDVPVNWKVLSLMRIITSEAEEMAPEISPETEMLLLEMDTPGMPPEMDDETEPS
jgi:hypothetical protein